MGVITTGVIPAGKVFGPIPPNLTLTDPALLIGHMTCDNRPDVHTVKVRARTTSQTHAPRNKRPKEVSVVDPDFS